MRRITLFGGVLALACAAAGADPAKPYAGQQQHAIKALSPQEVRNYLEGAGMGLAKAAELNRYPGPAHVLEHAAGLRLSRAQRTQTERLHAAMQAEAKALGASLVEKERQLDALFAAGSIDAAQLRSLVLEIGRLQAEVRLVHLQAHLEQKALLTTSQVAAYDALRGYVDNDNAPAAHRPHRH